MFAVRIANVEPAPSLELFVSGTQWIDAYPGRLEPHIGRLANLLAEEEGAAPGVSAGGEPPPEPSRLPRWTLSLAAAASVLLVIGAGLALWHEREIPKGGAERADPAVITEPTWLKTKEAQTEQQVAAARPGHDSRRQGASLAEEVANAEQRNTYEMITGGKAAGGYAFEGPSLASTKDEALNSSLVDLYDPDFRTCEKSSGDDAITACDRAIASGKFAGRSLSNLHNDRGFMLMQKGAIDAALVDLNKAIEIDSTNFYAFWNRGAIYAAKGDLARAQEDLTTALALNPDKGSKAKIEEALNVVLAATKAVKTEPDDPIVITDPSQFWRDQESSAAGAAPAYPAEPSPDFGPMESMPADQAPSGFDR